MGGNEVWKETSLPVFSRMQHIGKLKYTRLLYKTDSAMITEHDVILIPDIFTTRHASIHS